MESFAKLLTLYMEKAGISVEELATQITSAPPTKEGIPGVHPNTISRWKNGKQFNGKTQKPHKRQYVLDCIKPLGLNAEQSNQLLEASGYKILTNKEWQLITSDKQGKSTSFSITEDYFQEYLVNDKLANIIFKDDIKALFDELLQLTPYPIMSLLTQAHWDEPPCQKAILVRARQIYSPENVLYISPPCSSKMDEDQYFVDVAKQYGIGNVKDANSFKQALEQRVKNTDLFLLVSRFEQYTEALGDSLAKMIRSISDQRQNGFHVILWGGQKLEALKYEHGSLSLLNIATIKRWSELSETEVKALWEHRSQKPPLDDEFVKKILAVSGGHPQLLNKCFLEVQQHFSHIAELNLTEMLSQSDEIWQLFIPFTKIDQASQQRLCNLLEKEKLAEWQPYILDDLLRELYWKNLLVWRDNGLYWRCEAIRMAGKNILG
jgi:hypothetical protein